jgi:hypothetical protein
MTIRLIPNCNIPICRELNNLNDSKDNREGIGVVLVDIWAKTDSTLTNP